MRPSRSELAGSPGRVDKLQDRVEIACIGSAQGRNMGIATVIVSVKVESARPLDGRMIEVILKKDVCGDPCVSDVAIRERMNLHHAMMKPPARFQRTVCAVLDPKTCITKVNSHLHADLKRIDADVLFAQAIGSCPVPNLAQQPLVQSSDETTSQDISAASAGEPTQALCNVGLLEFVQLAARCDVIEFQTFDFVGIKRRFPFGLLGACPRNSCR